jgi:hypothetical protein
MPLLLSAISDTNIAAVRTLQGEQHCFMEGPDMSRKSRHFTDMNIVLT